MDYSLPDSSVHGISQARILEWVAIAFSRESSQPRDRTWVSCTAGRRFTSDTGTSLKFLTMAQPHCHNLQMLYLNAVYKDKLVRKTFITRSGDFQRAHPTHWSFLFSPVPAQLEMLSFLLSSPRPSAQATCPPCSQPVCSDRVQTPAALAGDNRNQTLDHVLLGIWL